MTVVHFSAYVMLSKHLNAKIYGLVLSRKFVAIVIYLTNNKISKMYKYKVCILYSIIILKEIFYSKKIKKAT